MRIIVTGGRDYSARQRLFDTLDAIADGAPIELVAEGGASGADALARDWATSRRIPTVQYRAQWDTYGPSAGPRRNGEMLRDVRPDLVVAFPGGRGTADMVKKAEHAGVPVRRVE